MIKKSLVTLHIIILSLLSTNALSQTYTDDSLAVRAILDSNELFDITVEEVTDSSEGRVVALDLTSKGINTLPSDIGKLNKLEDLNLYINNLTSLPGEMWDIINLKYLDIGDNNLTGIPAEIGNLNNLKELYFDRNNLTGIPAEIGILNNLEKLNLSWNNLTGTPAEIGKLNNLVELYLYRNNLTGIPAEIGMLNNLEKLYLGDNNLESLPAEIGKLNNLDVLDLFNNNLTDLPDSIVNLVLLYSLDMAPGLDVDYNKLCSLSSELKEWVDRYADNPDWEETQDCDISISFKPENKSKPYKLGFNFVNSSIKLELFLGSNVKLEVLDIKGRFIETLIDSYKQQGKYILSLERHKYSSGIYYLKLTVNNSAFTKKLVILR